MKNIKKIKLQNVKTLSSKELSTIHGGFHIYGSAIDCFCSGGGLPYIRLGDVHAANVSAAEAMLKSGECEGYPEVCCKIVSLKPIVVI